MKKVSIYVHIPFCERKCKYCDFLSFVAPKEKKAAYVDALLREIDSAKAYGEAYLVDTVFFGGGTPTALQPEQLSEILEMLKGQFVFSDNAEITTECNPGTVTAEDLLKLRLAGFNRLSIGLQSGDNEELEKLGRIHTYEQFLECYQWAREAGFTNINVDVMSALPGQKAKGYEDTLKKVRALQPEHISAYSLIIEEGTPFYELYGEADRQRMEDGADRLGLLPSEEEERAMYQGTRELLAKAGYERYEISNYCKSGYHCRHNVTYWTGGDYLSFGLGAASCMDHSRWSRGQDVEAYLEQFKQNDGAYHEGLEIQKLSVEEQMEEFMFLGLRMMCGVSMDAFFKRFGVTMEQVYGKAIRKLTDEQLVEVSEDRLRLTELGISVSNYALAEFLFD